MAAKSCHRFPSLLLGALKGRFKMQNTLVISPIASAIVNLVESRAALVNGIGKIGELIRGYSMALDQGFDLVGIDGVATTKWFDLQGAAFTKGIKAERKAFKVDMEEAGYSEGTINVYWQRVKEASGYVTAGNRVKGSVDIDAKTLAELTTMLNRIFNDETESKSQDVKPLLMQAFEMLGGETSKLGTK
jgi:hypothetical protein